MSDPFIELEAWIYDSGDGSASIQWFLPGKGPEYPSDEDLDTEGFEYDYEGWSLNDSSGSKIEVRHGGPEHLQAWTTSVIGNRHPFVLHSDTKSLEFFRAKNWKEESVRSSPPGFTTYIRFTQPDNWTEL